MLIGSNTDPRVSLLRDIVMNSHYIANLHDPNSPQDATTKNYVDSNISNKEGLVPILNGNTNNRSEHIASASTEENATYSAYVVFAANLYNAGNSEWAATTLTNF